MLYLNVGQPISTPPWLNITKWTDGWTQPRRLFLLFPHRQSRQWNRCASWQYNRTLICLICPINISYFSGWRVSLPYLSAAKATRHGGLASSCECFLCWCLFFTTRKESSLAPRTADHLLCYRSKHFTPSVVSSPVALLLRSICISPLSGVEDGAPFASTIRGEIGIWCRSSERRWIKWRELFGITVFL